MILCRSCLPLLAATLLACSPDPAPPLSTGRAVQAVRNGTRRPQVVDLTDEQVLAIGWLHRHGDPESNFCSATLIAPHVVATASHCVQREVPANVAFGVGDAPDDELASFRVGLFHDHPRLDTALLVLTERVTERLHVDPIPVFPYRIDRRFEGTEVEGAGFGETMHRYRDGLWFAALLLTDVWADQVLVDGRGEQGMCFGDSGGPILLQDEDGVLGLLGVESAGDESCVGEDHIVRLDALEDFVAEGIATEPPERPVDPCDGVGDEGACEGDVVRICHRGRLVEVDCAALGTTCDWVSWDVGHACTCGALDFLGRCDGDVAVYCDEGALQRVDCTRRRRVCRWVDDEVGYDCIRDPGCRPEDERCDDGVALRCEAGRLVREECAEGVSECAWTDIGPAGQDLPPEEPPPEEPPEPPEEEPPAEEPADPPEEEPAEGDEEPAAPEASPAPEGPGQVRSSEICATVAPAPGVQWTLLLLLVPGLRRRGR